MLAIFLDLETSGLDFFSHRVLEIAFKIVDTTTGEEKITYQTIVKQPWSVWNQHDPASVLVNGFTWDKNLQGKEEKEVREEIIKIFTMFNIERGNAVYICQNPAFDRGFFCQIIDVYTQEEWGWPYHWLDFASMYWATQAKAGAIPTSETQLSKNTIAEHFQLPTEPSPHFAINGVEHLLLCYKTVVGFDLSEDFEKKNPLSQTSDLLRR